MNLSKFDKNFSEIEAKICFQYNKQKKIISSVNIHEFQGIKHELTNQFEYIQYLQNVDIYSNNIRKIHTIDKDIVFQKKTRIEQHVQSTVYPHVFIKWTHSFEEPLHKDNVIDTSLPLLTRHKNVCKIKYNQDWEIYLVMVNGYSNCEIEIEFVGINLPDLSSINILVTNIFKHRYESLIIKQFNILICGKAVPYLNWSINKPVNLKFDMWKQIVDLYGFFLKMDGTRYLLFSHKGDIYTINETHRIQIIKNTRIPHNTILDAELVNETFHIFDILFYNGQDIRQKGMYFRNLILKEMMLDMNMEYTEIDTNFNVLWHYISSGLPEYTDGIVFFPLEEPYKNKCTYKYKPAELLTIDFMVKRDGLYVSNDDENLIPFIGNSLFPFQFVWYDDYQIDNIMKFQFKEDRFIPLRVRYDKIKPNYVRVALDIWEDIQNPIDMTSFVENILSCK